MRNTSKYLGFVLISILAMASFAFAGTAKVKGDIAGVDLNAQTMLLSTEEGFVQLNLPGSVMKRNGMGILPEDFQVGDRAYATYDPSTMNAIEVNVKGGFVAGFITSIKATQKGFYYVSVTSLAAKPVTVEINQKTLLYKNGEQINSFDYKVGDTAKVYYLPKLMMATKFMGSDTDQDDESPIRSVVKGYLVKIELGNQTNILGRITISEGIRKTVVMNVDLSTKISVNGTPSTLRDLVVGDFVTAISGINGTATSIRATRGDQILDQCEGYLVSVKIKGDFVPYFELVVKTDKYTRLLVFTLPLNAEVWKDGKPAKGFALKPGDFATILYDEKKMNIIKIEAWTPTK